MIPHQLPHALVARVPVVASAAEAYRTVFQNLGAIAVVMALPVLISQASWYLCFFTLDGDYDGLVWAAAEILPQCLFAVAVCRLVLLGSEADPPRLLPRWGRRYQRVMLILLVLMMVWYPFYAVENYLVEIDGRELTGPEELVSLPLNLVIQYVYLRLALALAAASVDEDFGVWWSWRTSSGQGLRIFAASFIAFVPLTLFLYAGEQAFESWTGHEYAWPDNTEDPTFGWPLILANVVDDITRYVAFALDLIILSSAFRRITGWSRQPQSEILERFE